MTKKIFRSIFLAAIAVLLLSIALIFGVLYEYTANVSQQQLRTQLDLAAQGLKNEGISYFSGLDTANDRITWINTDGTVLYDSVDSDTAHMENHLEREEVQQALKTGYGQSRRYSTTLMRRLLYDAKKMDDGTVLRLSTSQYSIFTLLFGMSQPILIVLGLAVLFSVFLAVRLAKNVVKPLNEMDLDHPLENEEYDELSPLLRRINSQQMKLGEQKQELSKKQGELNTILENMSEGMILLRSDGSIVSINAAAAAILGTQEECAGMKLLTVCRDIGFAETVESALHGQNAESIISLNNGRYQLTASPITDADGVRGATVVMFDVSDREQAEQMRREFTANVSHELKTPLHAISGYAELMKDNIVRQEDIQPFACKIYSEAQRTIQLVEDIISLSHLDEGADDMQWEKPDLYETAKAVVEQMRAEAERSDVSISITGESVVMDGIPALLQTMIKNLCDNAIKYNHAGGTVTVSVEREGGNAVLRVADTGIGIPEADQKRIFERFYRVDKSHSRDVGGTGLGLSIVKHAVMIHGGRIDVESTVGKGSCITAEFPLIRVQV